MQLTRFLSIVSILALSACATNPTPEPVVSPGSASPQPAPFSGMQWLYGSGEGAAASLQAYNRFRAYVVEKAANRPAESVVLASGASLASPRFIPCGDKPLAVILDVDETALQNLGYEYHAVETGVGFEQSSWEAWEQTGQAQVRPMPGAIEALAAVRGAGVTVIFNTNRLASYAAANQATIEGAGLGPARHGETLYLKGDVAPGSGKDPRRLAVAGRYCVLAMAGDQLGDFSDLFGASDLSIQARRTAVAAAPFARLWGQGWFVLSNPVYGSGLRGLSDEVFPPEVRWNPPAD